MTKRKFSLLATISLALLSPPARGDTFTWGGGDGNFSAAGSWAGPMPLLGGSASDVLVLPTPTTPTNLYTVTDDLPGTPWILNSLVLGSVNTGTPGSITLNGAPGASLLFDGPNPTITVSPIGYHTISVPIVCTSSLTVTGLHFSINAPMTFTAPDSQLTALYSDLDTPAPIGLNQTIVTGDVTRGSGIAWSYAPSATPSIASFGSGTITLDGAACFGIYNQSTTVMYPSNSSVTITNPIVIKGEYTELGQGGFDSVTYAGAARLEGYVLLYADTALSLAGAVTLDQSESHTLSIGAAQSGLGTGISITGNLIDDPDPTHTARNPLHLYDIGAGLLIAATANTYSTGTIIDSGSVTVAPDSTLGTGDITVGNPGTYWKFAQLNLNSPRAYAAAPHVDVYATLALVGPEGAIPLGSAPPTLHAGSDLVLGDNLYNNSDRYPDAIAVVLNNSTLELRGFGVTTETLGAISYAANSSIILQNPTAGNHTTTLHAPSLIRIDNAVVLITPVSATLGQGVNGVNLVLDSPPAATNGMLPPYIQMADSRSPTTPDPNPAPITPSFVTYGPNGITPVVYATMPVNGGTGAEIVDLSGSDNNWVLSQTNSGNLIPADPQLVLLLQAIDSPIVYDTVALPSNTSIYALRTATSVCDPPSGPATLTLQSGGLITYNYATSPDGANTITIQSGLDFGPGEALIHTAASALYYQAFPTELTGKVTIRNGLTKLGYGPLVLSNPTNDISGPITVYQGDLTFVAIPQATTSAPIALYPNTSINTQSSQTLNRPIQLLPGTGSGATVGISNGNTLTLASTIIGTGQLTIQGGTLVLDPAITWRATSGQININSALVLPGATVTLPTSLTISGGISGSGTLADFSAIFLEGTISPGSAPSQIASLKFDSPAGNAQLGWFETVAMDLDSSGSCDQLIFTCPLSLEPTFDPGYPTTLALNFLAPPTGQAYTLISATSLTGSFGTVTGLPDGYALDYTPTSLLLVPTTSDPTDAAPEPASIAAFLGLTPLLLRRQKRPRRRSP